MAIAKDAIPTSFAVATPSVPGKNKVIQPITKATSLDNSSWASQRHGRDAANSNGINQRPFGMPKKSVFILLKTEIGYKLT